MLQEAKDFPVHGTQTYADGKTQYEEEEEGTYFHLKELKEHLKTLPSDERHQVKGFERLRNLDNGQDPNEGNTESDTDIQANWKNMKTNLNPKTEREPKTT